MKVTTKFPNNLISFKCNKITLCLKLFIYKTISKGKYIFFVSLKALLITGLERINLIF